MRDEELFNGCNIHYSGDGYTKIPNFTTAQYIHGTELQLYSLNFLKYIEMLDIIIQVNGIEIETENKCFKCFTP